MYIQKEPVCIFTRPDPNEAGVFSDVFFHSEYPSLTFSEFLLYVVIPRVEDLQKKGYNVEWGYVDGGDHRDGLESYKDFLELEIEYEKKNSENKCSQGTTGSTHIDKTPG